MKLYMFRTVRLSIIRNLFTVHSTMVYVIQGCRQLSSRTRMELSSISNGICHTGLQTDFEQDQDGTAVPSAMVYDIQVCRQLSSRTRMELQFHQQWYMSYRFVDSFRAGPGSSILILLESCLQTCMTYTIVECTVNKLLMMDRRTVRNMQSFMTK